MIKLYSIRLYYSTLHCSALHHIEIKLHWNKFNAMNRKHMNLNLIILFLKKCQIESHVIKDTWGKVVVRPPPFGWCCIPSSPLVGGAAWSGPTFLSCFGVVLLSSPPLGGVALTLSLVGVLRFFFFLCLCGVAFLCLLGVVMPIPFEIGWK